MANVGVIVGNQNDDVGSPDNCSRENYTVEVDARWQNTIPSGYYGLAFGIANEYERYYVYYIVPKTQEFGVVYISPNAPYKDIVPRTFSSFINYGTNLNHLKVRRQGSGITLFVNYFELGTYYDNSITGPTKSTIISSPRSTPPSDARFDNFRISPLP
jgi:hypothetical protein